MHSSKLLLRFCGIGGAPFFAGVSAMERDKDNNELEMESRYYNIYNKLLIQNING